MRFTVTARTSDRTSAWALVIRHITFWIAVLALVALRWRPNATTAPGSSEVVPGVNDRLKFPTFDLLKFPTAGACSVLLSV